MSKTKILIAVDDPTWANIIVNEASKVIDKKNSEVTLINIIESTLAEEGYFYSEPEKFIKHEANKSSFSILEDFLENSNIDYKGFIYKEGNVSNILKKMSNDYDLIVLGPHNKNPLERFLLGSVSYKLARTAKCSVLIINSAKFNDKNFTNTEIYSVLLGIDQSNDSFNAVKQLNKFIDKQRAQVSLLNVTVPPSLVIPPDAYIYMDVEKIIQEANLISESLLEKASQYLQGDGVNVIKKYHVEGDAAKTILDEADINKITLIVLGAHGEGNISRWLLGSVSSRVYEHARQSVLIIK